MSPAGDSDAATVLAKYRSIYNSLLTEIIFAADDAAFQAAVDAFYAGMEDINISVLEAHYTEAHNAAK